MKRIGYGALIVISLVAPFVFPEYRTQLSFLWVMIIFALTWDILGGQMGYNSFGNVLFVGVGMYACAVVQRDIGLAYLPSLFIGLLVAGSLALAFLNRYCEFEASGNFCGFS